jgi:hypothetical protein
LLAAMAVLLGTAACTATDGDTVTVTASASGSTPGSLLFAGLRTPPGTLLLGGVFPRPNGSVALMLVTGDPLVAFADLAAQADRAGLSLEPTSSGTPCWVSTTVDNWWNGEVVPIGEPTSGRPAGLGCGAAAWSAQPDGTRRWLSLRMLVGTSGTPYLAHLVAETAVGDATAPTATAAPPLTLPAVASPVMPPPMIAVPAVGAPLLRLTPHDPPGPFVVAAGSELVAPAFPSDCGGGGFVAVLRSRGDAGSVIDEYAAELTAAGLTDQHRRSLDTPMGPATYVDGWTAGGGDGSVTALPMVDGVTHLMVARCGD